MEEKIAKTAKKNEVMNKVEENPLKKERIYIRFVPNVNSLAGPDKRHPLYGGLADGATVKLCVPMLRSTGSYKNVLTNSEKDFLERTLGLDSGSLSVYKKENNYWDNYRVELTKEGIYLDLSDPEDYIKYAVLRANSDIVAPSVQERIDRPKATYLFEIVRHAEETSIENAKMDATMSCYAEFKKIESDMDTMRVLVELVDARPYAANTTRDFLRARINTLIQSDPRGFLRQITDPMLHTKVVIRRATELGKLSKRGDFYYLKSDNSPLCDAGEEPTLSVAAKFLNLPSHQDVKFLLESEVDKNRAAK